MIESSYDVVVAGGGPAGLSAAQVAADHDMRVLLAEKHAEIGSPTRTSGGSFIRDMVALDVPPSLYHPVRRGWLIGPSAQATFVTPADMACVLNVRGLYQHLAQRAIASGASLSMRTQVLSVDQSVQGRQIIRLRDHAGHNQEVTCKLVIDASGFSSTLAVKAGLHETYRRLGVGAEYDLYAPNFPEDTVVLIVGSAIAPSGYAWAFPYGNHRVRAGVGVLRPDVRDDPVDYLDLLVYTYPPLREVFAGASPIEFHTGVLPAEGTNARLVSDGLITAGDSGGQSSALVGEGIRFSIHAGRLAGRVGALALQGGDVSTARLAAYEAEWERRFGRDLRLGYAVSKRLYTCSDVQWDAAIRVLAGLSGRAFANLLATDLSPGLLLRVAAAGLRRPGSLRTVAPAFLARGGTPSVSQEPR